MRNLLVIFGMALLVFVGNVQAQDLELEQQLFEYNQLGKINAAMINGIDIKIYDVQDRFNIEKENAEGIVDHMEGKIVAALIISIEDKLNDVKADRARLEDLEEVLDQDIELIENKLQGIKVLIEEINI